MHDTLDEATSATVSLANAIASASKAATSNSMQLLRFHRDTNSIMTSCVNFAASLSPPNTNVLIDSGEDIRLRVSLGQSSKILHLFAETTPSEVLGLLESSATQPAASSAPTEENALIIHLPPRFGTTDAMTPEHAWRLRDWFQKCELLTVVVCAQLVQGDGLMLPLLADVCVAAKACMFHVTGASNMAFAAAAERQGAQACSAFFRAKILTAMESHDLGLIKVVTEQEDVEAVLGGLTAHGLSVPEGSRASWGLSKRLPSFEAALLGIVGVGSVVPPGADVQLTDLVTLQVSEASVAIVTMNDPTNFNNLSATLVQALRVQLHEVHRLIVVGEVQAMVLQANGLHFCVGGGAADRSTTSWSGIVRKV